MNYTKIQQLRKQAYIPRDQQVQVGIYSPDENGDILELRKALRIASGKDRFTVPKGFRSDGASVPEFLWSTVTPPIDPRTLRASIAHDFIYRTQPKGWTRSRADKMFHRLILEDGLSQARADLAMTGLKNFGEGAWNESKTRIAALKEAARQHLRVSRIAKEYDS